MAVAFGRLEEFNVAEDEWNHYVERLGHYFAANEIDDPDRKKAILLSVCGSHTYRLMRNLVTPDRPGDKSYDELVKLVQNHIQPRPSVIVERYKFNSRNRRPGESVGTYVAELRQLTEFCEFGASLDDYLRDRIVCGIADDAIQRRLLSEPKLDLKKTLTIATTMETAVKNVKDLHDQCSGSGSGAGPGAGPSAGVNKLSGGRYVNKNQKKPGKPQQNNKSCHRCGGNHYPNNCRYKTSKCFECQKTGHIASACRNKTDQKSTNPKYKYQNKDKQTAHQLSENPHSENPECYEMYTLRGTNDAYYAKVNIDNRDVLMEIDTGASVSVVSNKVFNKIYEGRDKPQLKNCDMTLNTFTGETVTIQGSTDVVVNYENQQAKLPLVVVNGDHLPSLLGRNWLNHLKINWAAKKTVHKLNTTSAVQSVLEKYTEVFKDELGTLKGVKASIQVDTTAQPRFYKARNLPYALREPTNIALDKLVADDCAYPVQYSDWAAPIVPVTKPDKSVRICGDYKLTVNQYSQVDSYPIPKVEDLFASLNGGKTFTTLDLRNAYLQLLLDEESQKYTTINTHRGLYRYKRLPFGISSAPSIFQRTLENLLRGIPQVLVRLDDILITGSSEAEHIQHLDEVLKRLSEAGLRLRLDKCTFQQPQVDWVGHRIDEHGLRPIQDKIETVVQAPRPTNVSELKSFLGMVNYYAKFLPNVSTTLEPLHMLLRTENPWIWETEQEESFMQMKKLLLSPNVLVHFDPTKEIVLACDASPYGVGAVLSHRMPDGSERPIGFASRTLSQAERGYSQLDKEGLAVIFGVKKFHQYIYGHKFSVITDHKPLLGLFSEKKATSPMASARIARWALTLSAYNYTIIFKPGRLHSNADGLSRLPLTDEPTETPTPTEYIQLLELLDGSPVKSTDVKQWTSKDPVLSQVLRYTLDGWPDMVDTIDTEMKPYLSRRDELSVQDGCLLWGSRVIIPPQGREKILSELHTAHPGIVHMKAIARSYIWWPKLDADIEMKVRQCNKCQQNRKKAPESTVHPWEWPERPWSRIHMDFAGPFMGKMFLVLVDAHSKWLEVHPMTSITASSTIYILRQIFACHGLPETAVSDNGPTFTSAEFKEFMDRNGIKHLFSAPFHPASNGLAERAVQTFKGSIERMSEGTLQCKLSRFLFKQRITPHSTTGISPAELLMGRRLRSHLQLAKPDLSSKVSRQQGKQAEYHNKHAHDRQFNIGSPVYAKNFARGPPWLAGLIEGRRGQNAFVIKLDDGRIIRRHVDHIRAKYDNSETVNNNECVSPPMMTSHIPWLSEIEFPDGNEDIDNDTIQTPRGTPNAQWPRNNGRPLDITPPVQLRRSQRHRKPNRKFE